MKGLEKFEPDCYYHIVNHAVGSENLFRLDDNFNYFLKRFSHYMPSVSDTLAFCLMPNHIHFLVKINSEEKLKRHKKFNGDFHKLVMQQLSNLLNSYAKAYNKMYDRRGALWIDYTKRFKVENDNYLIFVINYIHQNPIKHGYVENCEEWAHSSYQTILSTKPTALNRNEVIKWFGNLDEYVKFHHNSTTQLLDEWE